jgi:hypothetical protein
MYKKIGNRVSLLPITQFCGLAGRLSEQHGAGRAAAMSSAWHAQAAGADDAPAKLARLTPAERDAIAAWRKPDPVSVLGHTLTYEAAVKEQPVGLTPSGEWADDGEVITCGTLDFAWVVEHSDPFIGRVAVVGDLKKTQWASSGPDSLQLLTYGYAWAKKHGCRAFMTGIWIIEDAEWQWSQEVYELDSFTELDLFYRIKEAALNTGTDASFGEHCGSCYGRLHCPEYTLPAQFAETVLAPVAAGQSDLLNDGDKLGELLAFCERVAPLLEKVKDHAKEAAKRGVQVRHPTTGKVLKFIRCKSPEALNRAKLFASIPEATKFLERGDGYLRMNWSKP